MRCLLLHLEAPLQSYGSEAVDSLRPTAEVPGRAMLTGLVANALGYRRTQPALLDALQRRVSYAARIDRAGEPLRDYQTVMMDKSDVMWTTGPSRAERSGGAGTYLNPHIRLMDYHADRVCVVAMALADGEGPTVDEVATALVRPARPLFLGRKTCLPSAPILAGIREGVDPLDILLREPLRGVADRDSVLVQADRRDAEGWVRYQVTDACDWRTRIFGGSRSVVRAYLPVDSFPEAA